MPDDSDLFPLLGLLLDAGLRAGRDGTAYAERIGDLLGLDSWCGAEAAERALRAALGLEACGDPVGTVTDLRTQSPRTVTRDGKHLVIPALRLDAVGAALLRTIINNEAADLEASS
jgi:hypothetical protein